MDGGPVEVMALDDVQAELRAVSGVPFRSEADQARRRALWRRLDELEQKKIRQGIGQ